MKSRLSLSDSRLLLTTAWFGFVSFNTGRVRGGLGEMAQLWGSTYAWIRLPGDRYAQASMAHPEGFEFALFHSADLPS